MKTAHVEPNLRASELEIENARLQRLVAELLARNQQLRQALESATYEGPDFLYAAPDTSACAAFFTESRMKCAEAASCTGNPGGPLGVEMR
jgi:alkylation response protein AidB-like acyl-CoA dehydrogenase